MDCWELVGRVAYRVVGSVAGWVTGWSSKWLVGRPRLGTGGGVAGVGRPELGFGGREAEIGWSGALIAG